MVKVHASKGARAGGLLLDEEKSQAPGGRSSKFRNSRSANGHTCVETPFVACLLRPAELRGRPGTIGCWGQVEAVLAELGRLEQELKHIAQEEALAATQAQEEADRLRRVPLKRRQELEAALERFCRRFWARRLRGKTGLSQGQVGRFRRLLFGRVGIRRSHSIRLRSEAAALRSLSATPAGRRFLRVQTEIDREGLRAFLFQQLREERNGMSSARRCRAPMMPMVRRLQRAGVRLAEREHWFYELNWEALSHWG